MSTDSDAIPCRCCGLVGLGIIGGAMAKHLVAAGHEVVGYDTDAAMRERAANDGVEVVASPADMTLEVVITSLPTVAAVESTLSQLPAQPVTIVETSTLPLADRLRLTTNAQAGHILLDCPVSGTGAQMAAGDAILYLGGDRDALETVRPVLAAIARQTFLVGDYGDATRVKLIANHLVAINNLATAEAILLGEAAGLDVKMLIPAIAAGAGGSRIFDLRAPMIANRKFSPPTMKLSVWAKDLAAIANLAKEVGAGTPLLDATLPHYRTAITRYPDYDTAAVALAISEKDSR
ncbi:NAD(P)-dependent oxidoreductase [Parasphingopyxis algicola]|uniref:NAD(P)-dependent oxidoreductase n=1 Tax=Parasphingopyxis algicola TaxID=2026624 RepID=UPI0015A2A5F0|nr:NAD(P)-dependent oxidoreductase [Parasphingopyxis algicola]QLC26407.1 NAD(P)-dependent oxidoreductase [Parasphingopyxis algicola]